MQFLFIELLLTSHKYANVAIYELWGKALRLTHLKILLLCTAEQSSKKVYE